MDNSTSCWVAPKQSPVYPPKFLSSNVLMTKVIIATAVIMTKALVNVRKNKQQNVNNEVDKK